jgi:cycloeucalenol cycloisomerase
MGELYQNIWVSPVNPHIPCTPVRASRRPQLHVASDQGRPIVARLLSAAAHVVTVEQSVNVRGVCAIAGHKSAPSLWLAEDAGKRWAEVFFLAYSPFWMLWALCILVPFRLYEVSNRAQTATWASSPTCTMTPVPWLCLTSYDMRGVVAKSINPAAMRLQHLSYLGYLLVGLAAAVPCLLLPLWLQPPAEARKPLLQRHWVKANIWVAIFSYIGNYFWTHYFYTLLGAEYTFNTWRLNDVRT